MASSKSDSNIIISTDMVYAIKVRSSGHYLDGRDTHYTNPLMTYTDNPQSYGSVLYWKFIDVGNGLYAMKCLGNNWYLDGRNGSKKNPLMTETNDPKAYGAPLHWKILSNSDKDVNGICYVSLKNNTRYLDGRDAKHDDVLMSDGSPNGNYCYTWSLIPLNCTLHADIQDFIFEDWTYNETLQYFDQVDIDAEVSGVTVSGSFTDTVENSFTYGFSESIGAGCGASLTCGIPTLMETTLSINFDFTFTSNQEWTHSESQTIEEEYSFKPPEAGKYEAGMEVYTANNCSMKFVAKVIFKGTNYNNDSNGISCNSNEILSLMSKYGNNCKIENIGDNHVEAIVNGVLTGGWFARKKVWTREADESRSLSRYSGLTLGNNIMNKLKAKFQKSKL